MATIRDVVAYLCHHYPHKDQLSKSRVTKMVYLVDWKSALDRARQITDIAWTFNHYGPYVDSVMAAIAADPDFEVARTTNVYGGEKQLIRVSDGAAYPTLTAEEIAVLDFVIDHTQDKYWNDFIRLVYSTYPVLTQPRYSTLDLIRLAHEYREGRHLFT